MKKLIKFVLVVAVVAIFVFSSNPTITKARSFVGEKGKELFQKGTDELKSSENETISKFGEVIE